MLLVARSLSGICSLSDALPVIIVILHPCHSRGSLTRNSAIADKPRDAFRESVKVTTHGTIPYVRYCFLLVCHSNFVPSRAVLQIFDFKECRDLEIWVRGHLTSLKMVPFNRLCMVSYYCPIVTLSVIRTIFEIFDFKNAVTLKTGLSVQYSMKVIQNVTIR